MVELTDLGYWGLFIASFLAGTVVPFSSEVVLSALLVMGYDWKFSLFVATIGNFIGGQITYYTGYLGKWTWVEKYFRVSKTKIEKSQQKVSRWGATAATLSFVPGLGNAIVLALGFLKIKPLECAVYMLMGKIVRYILWIYFTYLSVKGLS